MTTFDVGQDDFFTTDTDTAPEADRDLQIKAVVFDLGGVLLANGPRLGVIARLLGRTSSKEDQAEVEAAIWKFRTDYDLGGSGAEYWAKVAQELGVTDYDLSALSSAESDRWAHPLPDGIDLVDELESAPVKLAALCNAPRELATSFDDEEWSEPFSTARFSGQVGVLVPDPQLFALIERDLGLNPDQILFFDNNERHVEGARERGWDAHLWEDGEAARAILVERGILD